MGFSYLVQPVLATYAFCYFMTIPLLQQYVYSRLWEQMSSVPYSSAQRLVCANATSNLTSTITMVQKRASVLLLYLQMSFILPSMFSSLFLVSCSDYRGRKSTIVPPLLGNLFFNACCFLISILSLDLRLLVGAGFVWGLFGGPSALIGGCFAYVADRCRQKARAAAELGEVGGRDSAVVRPTRRRTLSIASMDLIMGLISGMAPAATGLFIFSIGFSWPFLIASLLHLLNLVYVLVVLRESLVLAKPSSNSASSTSAFASFIRVLGCCGLSRKDVLGQLQSVYRMFAMGSRRRNIMLGLVLATFTLYKTCKDGGMAIIILYQLNRPLCWSELLIGSASLLGMIVHLGSYSGVFLLSRWLVNANIVLIGLLSLAMGMLMSAFANTTLLMFLVRIPLLLSDMPSGVLRSMASNLVSSSEQGAVFACVVFLEMLSVCLALAVFNSTYAATVSWFAGFSFLLSMVLIAIPAILMGILKRLQKNKEDMTILTTN